MCNPVNKALGDVYKEVLPSRRCCTSKYFSLGDAKQVSSLCAIPLTEH